MNGVIDPLMFRCDDPENFQYNQATRQCTFQCRAEGRVPDRTNCQGYYECFRIGANYVSRLQSCITGYIYNDTVKQCVRGTCPATTDPDTGNGNDNTGQSNAGGGNGNIDPGNGNTANGNNGAGTGTGNGGGGTQTGENQAGGSGN